MNIPNIEKYVFSYHREWSGTIYINYTDCKLFLFASGVKQPLELDYVLADLLRISASYHLNFSDEINNIYC